VLAEGAVASTVRYALQTSGSRSLQYLDPDALGVDGSALAAGLVLGIATGLLSGLLPLRAASRADLTRDLRGGSRGLVARLGPTGEAGRSLLVATQLALTLVLMAGAGLMGASLARLSGVEPGFAHDDVLTLRFDRGPGRTPGEMRAFEEDLVLRLAALPGVLAVATGPCPPLAGACEVTGVRQIDDQPPVDFGDMEGILTYEVSEGYFSVLGVRLRDGRGFGPGDRAEDAPVAVVSEAAARRLFGGSAIGHRIAVTHGLTDGRQAEIVGVVADVRYGLLEEEPMPALYFSRHQATPPYGTLFVRTSGDPAAVVEAVRREVGAADPRLPLFDVSTLGERRASATARTRVILRLLLSFALLGLLLSAVGIYGVVSYAVVRRTREVGLRLALGAPARDVMRRMVAGPAFLAAAGAAAGLGGALALTRHVRGLLFGVEPGDPRVLATATLVLAGVALAAAWLPARRAARLDPAETLRGE